MRKLIPVILALVGLLGGAGGGYYLRPSADAAADHAPPADGEPAGDAPAADAAGTDHAPAADPHAAEEEEDHAGTQPEYVKLNNQFVVPVVEDGTVAAMVILSLSLEVTPGSVEAAYVREPKLRDVFLQVLFDHANAGGFRGTFTDGANLILLRQALLEMARRTLGDIVTDVLIVDIARQDT